jgi:hypothetical protein
MNYAQQHASKYPLASMVASVPNTNTTTLQAAATPAKPSRPATVLTSRTRSMLFCGTALPSAIVDE